MADSIAKQYRFRVNQRRRVVEYARERHQTGRPAPRSRAADGTNLGAPVDRRRRRGLVPRYPTTRKRRLPETTRELIRVARSAHRYSAARAQVWLKRVPDLHVNAGTIQQVFREMRIPVLTKTLKRRPKQMTLLEKDAPGTRCRST